MAKKGYKELLKKIGNFTIKDERSIEEIKEDINNLEYNKEEEQLANDLSEIFDNTGNDEIIKSTDENSEITEQYEQPQQDNEENTENEQPEEQKENYDRYSRYDSLDKAEEEMKRSSEIYKEYIKNRKIEPVDIELKETQEEYSFFTPEFLDKLNKDPQRKANFLGSAYNMNNSDKDFERLKEDIKHYPNFYKIWNTIKGTPTSYGEGIIRPCCISGRAFLVEDGYFEEPYTIEQFNFEKECSLSKFM